VAFREMDTMLIIFYPGREGIRRKHEKHMRQLHEEAGISMVLKTECFYRITIITMSMAITRPLFSTGSRMSGKRIAIRLRGDQYLQMPSGQSSFVISDLR